jgi:Txe/YoeB family toxin of toxin-antitoxin system
VLYKLQFTSRASKQLVQIAKSPLYNKIMQLLKIIESNPFQNPPPFKKLKGDLSGLYSRRINEQHRLVYQVYEKELAIKIMQMWEHY